MNFSKQVFLGALIFVTSNSAYAFDNLACRQVLEDKAEAVAMLSAANAAPGGSANRIRYSNALLYLVRGDFDGKYGGYCGPNMTASSVNFCVQVLTYRMNSAAISIKEGRPVRYYDEHGIYRNDNKLSSIYNPFLGWAKLQYQVRSELGSGLEYSTARLPAIVNANAIPRSCK